MEQNSNAPVHGDRSGVTRRVVVKSAAWSVPVFAAVGVTPAFAFSSPNIVGSSRITATRTDKSVEFVWTFELATTVALVGTNVTITSGGRANTEFTNPSTAVATSTGLKTYRVTFTGKNKNTTTTVPSFTIRVDHNPGVSTLFTVVGDTVSGSGQLTVTS